MIISIDIQRDQEMVALLELCRWLSSRMANANDSDHIDITGRGTSLPLYPEFLNKSLKVVIHAIHRLES